jgi:ATP-binding protein involved in chromosome partitioning
MVSEEKIIEVLREVEDPELHRNLVELGMVEKVDIAGETVRLQVALTVPTCPMKDKIEEEIVERLTRLNGVKEVKVNFTTMPPQKSQSLIESLSRGSEEKGSLVSEIKNIIAVASGKGGVGKSTVTANLAVALAKRGRRVGVLDADVYGFSIPTLLGIRETPKAIKSRIIPPEKFGIKIISIGFFVNEDTAIIWRGPLLHKAITQFIEEVEWGELDYLLIDLPPGTGDVTISIAQKLPGASVLVVTTPQRLATSVASRIGSLAEKTGLKLLGVVENMSYFLSPEGKRYDIFGLGGGPFLAAALRAPLFCQIPLEMSLRRDSDQGIPAVFSENAKKAKAVFEELASQVEGAVSKK